MRFRIKARYMIPAVLLGLCLLAGTGGAESSRIAWELHEEYGTELGRGTLTVHADTSTSIVADWRKAEPVDAGHYRSDGTDIVYKRTVITDGHHTGEPLDLSMRILSDPRKKTPQPAILFIPGGGFMSSVLDGPAFYYACFAAHGYVTASAEYRTIGQGRYMDGVADIRDAIRFLRAHAEEYGIDPERIALFGMSAGGHMAALAGVAPDLDEFRGENNLEFSHDVQAVVCLYASSDLTRIAMDLDAETQQFHTRPEACEAQYVNGVLSGLGILDDPEEAARANPITYVHGGEPPFLHMHGERDNLISPSMSLLLHNALLENGDDSVRVVLRGDNHSTAGFYTIPALRLMARFLEDHLGQATDGTP